MTGHTYSFIRLSLAYTVGLHFHHEWTKAQIQDMGRFEIAMRYSSNGSHKVRNWQILTMDAGEKRGLV